MDDFPDVPLMGYDQIRSEIRSGDVLLCSGSSPMARLIQTATGSVFSHVGFLMRLDAINRVLVLESIESVGVGPAPVSCYVNNYLGTRKAYPGRVFIARDPRFAQVQPADLIRFSQQAVDLFRSPYDNREIAGIAWRIAAEKMGHPMSPRKPDGAFICSEYLEICQQSLGLAVPRKRLSYITPGDYATACEVLWELALAT